MQSRCNEMSQKCYELFSPFSLRLRKLIKVARDAICSLPNQLLSSITGREKKKDYRARPLFARFPVVFFSRFQIWLC